MLERVNATHVRIYTATALAHERSHWRRRMIRGRGMDGVVRRERVHTSSFSLTLLAYVHFSPSFSLSLFWFGLGCCLIRCIHN